MTTCIPVAPAGRVVVCEPWDEAGLDCWAVGREAVMTTTAVEGSSGRADVRETLAEDGELTLEEPTKEEIRELRCSSH